MYNKYVRDKLGHMNVASIKYSDIRRFYLSLIHEQGFKPNSMEIVHTILHPVFTTAVRDGFIRVNPTDGVMAEIKKSHDWEKPKRHALTEAQQEARPANLPSTDGSRGRGADASAPRWHPPRSHRR